MTTRQLNDNYMIFFIGIVESLDDPLKLGRVKIRIINDNEENEISTDDLRFAYPMTPITSASLGGVGISPTGVEVGSYAFGFYLDQKEKNIPILIGTYNKIPENNEKLHDVSPLARDINNIKKEYYHVGNVQVEPTSAYSAEYPNNKTYTTKSGHAIEIDDTPDHERIHVYHKSGSYTEINENGRWVRKVVGNDYEVVITDKETYVKGNMTVIVGDNCTINAGDNVTVKAGGNMGLAANGDVTILAGGDMGISVSGRLTIQSKGQTTIDSIDNNVLVNTRK